MKSIIGVCVMALLLVCLAVPNLVKAGAVGASAVGSFKFALEDGETRFVEFKAEQTDGQAAGEMTFSDPVATPVQDPDNPEEKTSPGVLVRAKFDCMETSGNTAVMGGEIYDSNVPSNIGLRVLLVVEDNGVEGEKDRVAWGIFQQPAKGWVPSDAEVEGDKGASLTWMATDFDRKDDAGIPMPLDKLVACESFPVASIEYPEIKYGGGDLQVGAK
jgi:hypothetical protein